MSAELLVYAVLAAVLVVWLRNILGSTHGEERERPNPLAGIEKNQNLPNVLREKIIDVKPQTAQDPFAAYSFSSTMKENLQMYLRYDRNFDVPKFLDNAKEAFALVVESFAQNDTETLQQLLAPDVYKSFLRVIEDRKAKGETVTTDIHAVRQADIIDVKMTGAMCFITVRIQAEETCVVRDKAGQVLSGHPDRITTMIDVWTFGRDGRSSDPTWLIYETRDDEAETHKTPYPHQAGSLGSA
jgi:predicted lipid-binding transport protein (Tim44 family)